MVGQSVTVSVTVASGGGTPGGSVNVTTAGGGNPTCEITLGGGSGACDLTFTSAGAVTITAAYAGSTDFNGSFDTKSHTVNEPNLVAGFVTYPSPANILTGDTVVFTDTSTTDGPAIVAWAWDFGDGGVSAAQYPTHTYTSSGTFTVTLVVTDALGYSDDEVKPGIVVVSPRCTGLISVSFTYQPLLSLVNSPITFTAIISPLGATTPITYVWDFGDGITDTVTSATIQHTYTISGTYDVSVTAYNLCTPVGEVSSQATVIISPWRVYLPLVLRNY
jgi:PKD repeat protein